MYKAFFGLNRNPFEIGPDPYFFYPTARHNEALANLYYGIRKKKGFVVVTGEVGTGKTLLIRCLMDALQRSQIEFAYVFNTQLSPDEFLRYVVGDFGLDVSPSPGKSEMLLALNEYLIQKHSRGQTTALIVDEAQNLHREVLEEIRLLTNLETTQQKLLQIVLVGQPELDAKLDSVKLRQLKQRIALRCNLEPLSLEETPTYIQRRLELAGAGKRAGEIFPKSAVERIHHYSHGIPRLINTICENALLSAFAVQASTVSEQLIEEVARDFRLNVVSTNGAVSSEQKPAEADGNLVLDALLRALTARASSQELEQPAKAELVTSAKKEAVRK